jgi:hypothetical protein
LYNRVWIIQERALLPWTLELGTGMVYQECVCGKAGKIDSDMKKASKGWISRHECYVPQDVGFKMMF